MVITSLSMAALSEDGNNISNLIQCMLFGIPSGTPFWYSNTTANLQHCVIVLLFVTPLFSSGEPFFEIRNPGMAIFNRSKIMWYQTEAVITQISKSFHKVFTGELKV